jgi:hypothetical protein
MHEFLPGTGCPAPALMTAEEAALYLRLASPEECKEHGERVVARLNRLVDKGLLRPCMVGGKRRYARSELNRFITSQTDQYSEAR